MRGKCFINVIGSAIQNKHASPFWWSHSHWQPESYCLGHAACVGILHILFFLGEFLCKVSFLLLLILHGFKVSCGRRGICAPVWCGGHARCDLFSMKSAKLPQSTVKMSVCGFCSWLYRPRNRTWSSISCPRETIVGVGVLRGIVKTIVPIMCAFLCLAWSWVQHYSISQFLCSPVSKFVHFINILPFLGFY